VLPIICALLSSNLVEEVTSSTKKKRNNDTAPANGNASAGERAVTKLKSIVMGEEN